ncbi:DUF1289 domain-containing protein [Haematobacter massiliensis]|uniref:Uncharacterized protein n=1 Tax=Haematobacter massiliensis TaxID=195105 RepID=A0A086Y8J7_9RHOB|nr:DUF1289 domain-containing protein [Haematobacter massiliensis]KFI30597.1 hypothetical protein CN97_13725 [Haematobacter massiliensis]OWJ71486.1 DUF1289 domain-containing protein [Haematobacter massiliensis]OWJ87213.1 DUF1289 domain-containing protein [Haematobacter massiliensis]QBJ25065.1 DUF1289 domain-containing protein [Haematobacter massiliensis]
MTKLPSPCLSVCKFRRAGHCIACSMTKEQKSLFKKLKKEKHQQGFLTMLVHQQRDLGKFPAWGRAYARKCGKKGIEMPTLPGL